METLLMHMHIAAATFGSLSIFIKLMEVLSLARTIVFANAFIFLKPVLTNHIYFFFRNGVSPASASIDAHSRFIAKFQAFTSIKQWKIGNQLAIV
jgi:hypothetical protein